MDGKTYDSNMIFRRSGHLNMIHIFFHEKKNSFDILSFIFFSIQIRAQKRKRKKEDIHK